jgi:hypothetical protein
MINVSNIISQHIVNMNNIITLESLYNYSFNPNIIPVNIIFRNNKPFDRNIDLKNGLHATWSNSNNLNIKGDIIEYYIKVWGGIRGNSAATMSNYRTQNTNQLLNIGYSGISSWSKALVIHNPSQYFIYDSRVAISINWLQIKYNLGNNYKFSIPPSQATGVGEAQRLLNLNNNWNNWANTIPQDETYSKYLELLNLISINTGYNKSKIEMILFSIAPNLADEIKYLS